MTQEEARSTKSALEFGIQIFSKLSALLDEERDAIASADLAAVERATSFKEKLLGDLQTFEARFQFSKNENDREVVLEDLSKLKQLASEVRKKNSYNQSLLEKSLKHVEKMKQGVLGDSDPKSEVYSSVGAVKASSSGEARFISKQI